MELMTTLTTVVFEHSALYAQFSENKSKLSDYLCHFQVPLMNKVYQSGRRVVTLKESNIEKNTCMC